DADQTYATFACYVADAHAQGWKVVVSTEFPRPDFSPDKQAALLEYNRQVRMNAAGADAVVDFAADPRMGDPAARDDPARFTRDRVHPSDGGYTILGQLLAAGAQRLLPP